MFFKRSISEEGRHISGLLKGEFEASGVHLPQSEQEKVLQLQSEVSSLSRAYFLAVDNPSEKKEWVVHKELVEHFPRDIKKEMIKSGENYILPVSVSKFRRSVTIC